MAEGGRESGSDCPPLLKRELRAGEAERGLYLHVREDALRAYMDSLQPAPKPDKGIESVPSPS